MKIVKIKSIKRINHNSKRYDIETKNNHNFFANGILVHNSSFTAYLKDGKFGVCSRNFELSPPGNSQFEKFCSKYKLVSHFKKLEWKWNTLNFPGWQNNKLRSWVQDNVFGFFLELVNVKSGQDSNYWSLAKELDLEAKMRQLGMNLVIQGEMCGPGIQKNKYEFDKKRLFVFSIMDLDNNQYFSRQMIKLTCDKLGLETVPFIIEMPLPDSISELVQWATRKSILNLKTEAEGIVIRPVVPAYDNTISKLNHSIVSFKVINPRFQLKYDE